jgi:hypothetical protein
MCVLGFFVALGSSSEPACPATITTERFLRCSLRGAVSLSLATAGSTAVYVHNSRSASLVATAGDFEEPFSVAPGSGIQIFLSGATTPPLTNSTFACTDCLVTIWHSRCAQTGATFVSDVPGAVFTTGGRSRPFAAAYAAFFDFGNSTRFRVDTLQHHREEPLAVVRSGDGGVQALTDFGRSLDLTGPGIFQMASSPILPVSFRIIVGSTDRIPDGFSNTVGLGEFAELSVVDGALLHVPAAPAPGFVLPAVENTAWLALSWVFCALSILLIIGCLIYCILGMRGHVTIRCCTSKPFARNVLIGTEEGSLSLYTD